MVTEITANFYEYHPRINIGLGGGFNRVLAYFIYRSSYFSPAMAETPLL